MGPTHEGVGITALPDIATLQARTAGGMAYTLTLERHGKTDALASVEPVVNVTARHNVWNIHPHSCTRVVVPNSPHMVWVDPGEGTFTAK